MTVYKFQKLALVDKDTGTTLENEVLMIGQKPKYIDRGKGKTFVKVFVTFLSDIVEDEELAGKAIRLLMYMLEHLDFNDLTITMIPKYAIADLKIGSKTYYRWLDTLIKKGIVEKIDTYKYQLYAYTAIKGSQAEVNARMREEGKTIEKYEKKYEKRVKKTDKTDKISKVVNKAKKLKRS